MSARPSLYCSLTENDNLPGHFSRHGRDYETIAQALKTKTVEEVKKYLEHNAPGGDHALANLADGVNALRHPSSTTMEAQPQRHHESLLPLPMEPSLNVLQLEDQYTINQDAPHSTERFHRKAETGLAGVSTQQKPPRKPKDAPRPVRRCYCPVCPDGKEFRDEYSCGKHFDRFHKPFQKTWVCTDVSVDRRFLAGCTPCDFEQGYQTKRMAERHLNEKYFRSNAPTSKLSRWIREKEETNQRFKGGSDMHKDNPDRLPSVGKIMKSKSRTREVRLNTLNLNDSSTVSSSGSPQGQVSLEQG